MAVLKIGITGSKGFIGKHLVDVLKKRGGVNLFYFDLPEQDLLNFDSVKKFIADKDIIIHTAAVNRGSSLEIIAGGVVATHNLISAIKNSRKKIRLIFLSSTQAETETVYGLSKKLAEIMLQDFALMNNSSVTVFRSTNVFGEGCRPFYNSVVATFCHQAASNLKLTVDKSNKKINLIYVRDLVDLLLKEIFLKRKSGFYFKRIVTANTIAVRDLADLIKSFKGIKDDSGLKSKFHRDLYKTYASFRN